MCGMSNKSKGKMFFMFIFLAPLLIALYTYIVMSLWNWLMPDISSATSITFWQAFALILLVKLLFGFGFKGKSGGCNYKKRSWKDKMKDKFENMSDDEKSKFKEKWSSWTE